MFVMNWKQRLGHAELGWLPCCVSSRPRLHVRQNGPASAGLAPLSPPMWQHRQKVKPSTMSWEHHVPMPAENNPLVLRAGQIVLADWRGDARPKEPNKRRPAVVVEDDTLFAPSYPNAILVPLTEDKALAIPDLSVAIDPTAENGCSKPCWAVSHLVATTSKSRLRATPSRITPEQLAVIRRQIALAIGIES
jgi:mRNA interferase MazF